MVKKKLNSESINSLMTAVRKNTQSSACIDIFAELLSEVDNDFAKCVISDMNKFVEEFMSLCKEIDNMSTKRFVAKMLSDEFIMPERFFKSSLKMTNKYLYLNAAMNMVIGNTYPNPELKFTIGETNRLGDVWKVQHFDRGAFKDVQFAEKILRDFNVQYSLDSNEVFDIDEIRENCRKSVLLWNYLPAIVKAFMQTKRRSLELDKNSKKFV